MKIAQGYKLYQAFYVSRVSRASESVERKKLYQPSQPIMARLPDYNVSSLTYLFGAGLIVTITKI